MWASLCTSFPIKAASNIDVITFTLSNGLKVILAPLDNVEATCVMLYHLTGVSDDPPDMKGASYLYQTLMLGGTQNLDPLDRINFTKRYGGTSDGRINYDNSIFCLLVPDSELNNALWLESERIGSLRLEDQSIDILKNSLYKRFSRLNTSNVHFRATNLVKSVVFEGTVYQTPIYGDLGNMKTFNNRRIKRLYNNFVDLSRIIMVISGKFNVVEAKEAISKRFDRLSTKEKLREKKNYLQVKPRAEYVYKNWVVDNLRQPFVLYGIRAPSKRNKVDWLYFKFIRYYLVDKRVSKLERMLNQRNDLDVTISYEYTDHFETNALLIKITAKQRLDLERAKYVFTRELSALADRLISGADVRMVRTLMEIDFKKNMRDLKKRGLLLAENYHLFGEVDIAQEYLKRLRKISPPNIRYISKKYLKKENLVVLNVYAKK
jgi:predicted Zn-dependent peptidase